MKRIGLIPAAGKGSRLGLAFPKELLPIPLRDEYFPVILSNILALKKIDIIEIIIIINSEKTEIMKYLGNGSRWKVKIDYCVVEEPISLPDSLSRAFNLIENREVFFLMADTFIENDDFLINFNKRVSNDFEISLGCFYTNNPSKFATLGHTNGIVDFCEEKNANSLSNIMWGFWRWNPSFSKKLFDAVKKFNFQYKEQTMSEIIQTEISNKSVQAILLENYTYWDFGTFDEINEFVRINS